MARKSNEEHHRNCRRLLIHSRLYARARTVLQAVLRVRVGVFLCMCLLCLCMPNLSRCALTHRYPSMRTAYRMVKPSSIIYGKRYPL